MITTGENKFDDSYHYVVGFAMDVWDTTDLERHQRAINEISERLEQGWHIISHTTVATGLQVIQTVVLVRGD